MDEFIAVLSSEKVNERLRKLGKKDENEWKDLGISNDPVAKTKWAVDQYKKIIQ